MSAKLNTITAAVLIFLGVYINIPFTMLSATFDYPHVLRYPTSEVLMRFAQGGPSLIGIWYAFALCPLLLIVAAKLLGLVLQRESENLSALAATFGVLAGVFQVLGLIRWVFLVPALAAAYSDPNATAATRAAVEMTFVGFHQYAGVAIGEHLGQLCTALWLAFVSAAMWNSKIFSRWTAILGFIIVLMLLLGLSEGFATVVQINAAIFAVLTPVAFILLSLWMILTGVMLLLRRNAPQANDPSTV
jgi:Domain of unknown function (DUF4386)